NDFTLSTSVASLSVPAGRSVTAAIAVIPRNSIRSSVNLTASGLHGGTDSLIAAGRSCEELALQLENPLHQHPFLTGSSLRQRLLKSPHEILSLLHLGVQPICSGFCLEREVLIDLHDHEHSRAEKIDLHVHDARISDALYNLRPDFLMVPFVVGDRRWVVFEIQRKTESSVHAGRSLLSQGLVHPDITFLLWLEVR